MKRIFFVAALLLGSVPAFAGQDPPQMCPGSSDARQMELREALSPASPWRTAGACLWDRTAVYAAVPTPAAGKADGAQKD